MIIWQGLGFLALLIPLLVGLIIEFTTESITHNDQFFQETWWPMLATQIVNAIIIFTLGQYLEKRPAKVVIDKETGKEIVLKKKHTLFFIPLKYWSIVWLGVGAYFAAKKF